MNSFDEETRVSQTETGRYTAELSDRWNIGANPNGGYVAAIAVRAMLAELEDRATSHPDPLTVTTHFLRPAEPGTAEIDIDVIRIGRSASTVRAQLTQQGRTRIAVLGSFGDLAQPMGTERPRRSPPLPLLAPPSECVDRSELDQEVELPLLERVEVLIHPDHSKAATRDRAEVLGWIRFVDGRPPDTLGLMVLADAFPPAVYPLVATTGWVPTVELTVHPRRRPGKGWLCGRFVTDDIDSGRMVEDGTLWDNTGAVVARSRQLALFRGASDL